MRRRDDGKLRGFWKQARVLLGVSAPMGLLLAMILACQSAMRETAEREPRKVAIQGAEMIIQGPVDAALAEAVRSALAAPHARIATVLLTSSGGEEVAAFSIKDMLAALRPVRIVVPPEYACESACLLIALAGTEFEPADNSALLFHREWKAYGPQSCWYCWIPNWIENIGLQHRAMQRWANALALGLGDHLARCRRDPFESLKGRTITGREFRRFRAGDAQAILCPDSD